MKSGCIRILNTSVCQHHRLSKWFPNVYYCPYYLSLSSGANFKLWIQIVSTSISPLFINMHRTSRGGSIPINLWYSLMLALPSVAPYISFICGTLNLNKWHVIVIHEIYMTRKPSNLKTAINNHTIVFKTDLVNLFKNI